MKIELTTSEIQQLCNEHTWFMEKIIELASRSSLVEPTFEKLFSYEIASIKNFGPNKKIQAIKWLREHSLGKTRLCEELTSAGYDASGLVNGEKMLSLKGAKEFVEKVLGIR